MVNITVKKRMLQINIIFTKDITSKNL